MRNATRMLVFSLSLSGRLCYIFPFYCQKCIALDIERIFFLKFFLSLTDASLIPEIN